MEDQKNMLEEVLYSLDENTNAVELIQDNKLLFPFKDEIYRVRMPSQKERTMATNEKNKLYWNLIKEGQLPFEKDLRKELKEKQNIDIDLMQQELNKLGDELVQTSLSLASKKDTEQVAIDNLKNQILELKYKRKLIILEKAQYLSACIEVQVQDIFYKFLTALCTEKLIKSETEKWEKVWISFEDFEKDQTILSDLAGGKFAELFFHG
jgi:hypothetical protein